MKIETKFDVGDEVWFDFFGSARKAVIGGIEIEYFSVLRVDYIFLATKTFKGAGGGFSYRKYEVHEEQVFATKQELLNSL